MILQDYLKTCCFSYSFADNGLFSHINGQNNNLVLICFLTGAFVTYHFNKKII